MYSSFYKNFSNNPQGVEDKEVPTQTNISKIPQEGDKEVAQAAPEYPPDVDPEELTTAFLHDLVNRINPLPITDSKLLTSTPHL